MEPKKLIKLPSVDPKEFHFKPKNSPRIDHYLTPQNPVYEGFSDFCNKNRRGSLNQKLPSLEKHILGSNSPCSPFSPNGLEGIDLSPRFKYKQRIHPDLKNFEFRCQTSLGSKHRPEDHKIHINITNIESSDEKDASIDEAEEAKIKKSLQVPSSSFQRFKYKKHRKGRGLEAAASEIRLPLTKDDSFSSQD
ncbi:unnamed protein product [Blepharisma stoltei]|uniref:Uncharacterized protein n=1 Tax=Blepharisma stoltei TaxID=1481888 RepID=A0AAU9K2L8_9CILI|nr:unnamed protein product [Blepharisma stoltei]